jgi:hypothetical protein
MPRAEFTEEFENSSGTLIFPRDMGKPFSPEAIKFSIYKREGASYGVVKKAANAVVTDALALGEQVEGSAAKVAAAAKADAGNAKAIEGKRATAESPGVIKNEATAIVGRGADLVNNVKVLATTTGGTIKEFVSRPKGEASIENHVQSIYLNMPNSVVFNESVEWQGTDLGVLGALKSGATATDAAEVGLLGNAGAIIGGAAGAVTSALPGISGIAGTVVGAVAGSGGLQSSIESTFGVKANPYKEQTFQGVGFRSFDFTFALRARSQPDVNEIQKIITSFRAHSKPEFKNGAGQSGVFAYPKEFRIEFLTIDDTNSYDTNPYIPEIKYCVCTAVNTNFTQQGWKAFDGGAPIDISLQLTFQETEIITNEDVMGNTSVGRFKDSARRF